MTLLPRLCGKIADNYDKSYSGRVLKNALTQWAFPILEVALVLKFRGYNCRLFRHQYRSSIECQMHGILQLIVPKEIGFPLC